MASVREHYDTLRGLGMTKSQAIGRAFVNSCRDDEREQRERGVDYDEVHVRQAIVHSREDQWLIIEALRVLNESSARTNRRLTLVVVLLCLIAAKLYTG